MVSSLLDDINKRYCLSNLCMLLQLSFINFHCEWIMMTGSVLFNIVFAYRCEYSLGSVARVARESCLRGSSPSEDD